MALTQSTTFLSAISFIETTSYGDQSQVEEYSITTLTEVPTGTGGTPTNYFNSYAKSTGTLAAGSTLTMNFFAAPHQAITGGDVTRQFTHINAFYFEPTSATGTNDTFIIRASGSNAFTNLFYGGSGGPDGYPVRAYSPFVYTDYYGTEVTPLNKFIQINNSSSTGLDYKYMVVGFTGIV